MAGTSMLTEAIKGKKLTEVKKMTETKAMSLFGTKINPARKKCATLGWVALQHVLANH
jgi:NifU-like protein involved in Fe-S cluster formation